MSLLIFQRSDSDFDESQLDLASKRDIDVFDQCPNLVCSVLHPTHRLLNNAFYCRLGTLWVWCAEGGMTTAHFHYSIVLYWSQAVDLQLVYILAIYALPIHKLITCKIKHREKSDGFRFSNGSHRSLCLL